jgi:peptide/nickel transport system substrate-binding protein
MWKRLMGVGAVVAAVAVGVVAQPTSAQPTTTQEEQVTIVIGLTQPWETLNPVIGFAVPEYEFWTIQYQGLTGRAAGDYAPVPGLAEKWVENDPGLSYTYTLREDAKWSDGTPLTADDIAWTINTSRDQEWANYIASVGNLTAVVDDERTVTVTSSVADPKLPAVEIYFVPKHIWEPVANDDIESYEALDGVGSGPFVLEEYKSEESLTMVANENWVGDERGVDKVVFRYFSNPDAMVAALQSGEIDAAQGVPASAVETLQADTDIEVVAGLQGGFEELAMNAGAAEGQPHPALTDIEFRQAINHGLDKQGAVDDLWFGLSEIATTISVGADLKWVPQIPEAEQLSYDPAKAMEILDAAGYVDTNDDGFREMPEGGDNIVLRHGVNTDIDRGAAVGELFTGWMKAIGIDVELSSYDQDQLFEVIVEGSYDTFFWGWTPFVDPNLMLSYWTEAELGNFNDANWSDPRYEELYVQQQQETDEAKRLEIVHEMVRIVYDNAAYPVLWYSPDIQAYRTDTFEGWVRQPEVVGPVMFSQTSPSYAQLTPVGGGGGGGGLGTSAMIGIGAAALTAVAAGALAMSRKRKTADDRE